MTYIDNGDGTISGPVIDNGDGTFTAASMSGLTVADGVVTTATYETSRKRPGVPVWTPDQVLRGSYESSIRVEVLDHNEGYLGVLDGVLPGGSSQEVSNQAIHGGGSFTLLDTGQDVDWLSVRLRPVKTVTHGGTSTDYPLGVFIPALPTDTWTDTGRTWDVELTDKLGILDTSLPTGGSTTTPVTFGVSAGQNALAVVRSLIEDAGESAAAIGPGVETISGAQSWDVGTSTLQIINDILKSAGYFSLWCDRSGQYRVTGYVSPADRVPVYSGATPFTDGITGMMDPNWQRTQDIYDIPNAVYLVSQGDDTNAALTSIASVSDPDSPYAIQNLPVNADGVPNVRWKVYTDVEATSQQALDTQALMRLSQSLAVASSYSVQVGFLPLLAMNQAVEFVTSDRQGSRNDLCYITSLSIPWDPGALCDVSVSSAIGSDLGSIDDEGGVS